MKEPNKNSREVMIELLKIRGLSEEQAQTATDLFYTNHPLPPLPLPPEETLNDFLRELVGRALMLPLQMFLARVPEADRQNLERKLYAQS